MINEHFHKGRVLYLLMPFLTADSITLRIRRWIVNKKETVFVVSDSIGETAELMVKAVASQFFGKEVEIKHFSYVEDIQDINNVITNAKYSPSIIAYTIALQDLKEYLDHRALEEGIMAVDLMHPLMDAFAQTFDMQPSLQPGQMRKLDENYFKEWKPLNLL